MKKDARNMVQVNLYELLEVSQSATIEEITKSYRRLARKYHPDSVGNDSTVEQFKKIVEAYEILSDPNKRAIYNSKLPKSKPLKVKKPLNKKGEVDYSRDPNLGNIIDVPPSNYDLWGQPINKPKEKGFVDSVFYEDESSPYLR